MGAGSRSVGLVGAGRILHEASAVVVGAGNRSVGGVDRGEKPKSFSCCGREPRCLYRLERGVEVLGLIRAGS